MVSDLLANAKANTLVAPSAWFTWRRLITQEGLSRIPKDDLDYVLQKFREHEEHSVAALTEANKPSSTNSTTTTDTNIRIVTRNIRGIADNLSALLRCRSDIYI